MPSSSAPRSILKCSSVDPSSVIHRQHKQLQHHPVRFPSSPKLSTVYFTHCPTSYDRTPITVLPNSCALPERGGREYSVSASQTGNHLHPSVLNRLSESCFSMYEGGLVPPALSSDDGSSEESDGIASPPPETASPSSSESYRGAYVPSQAHLHSDPLSHPPIPQSAGQDYDLRHHHHNPHAGPTDYSLSFLPHAPPPCSSRKRLGDRSKSYPRESRLPAVSFGSSWGQTDESSCLGGF